MRRDVQPPLRFQNPQLNELATDPLSLADYDSFILRSKKDSMTSLQQKLNQLNLATMSQQLDQMLTDATAKNLSLAQTLEALVDRELESVTNVPSNAASSFPACRACLRSIASPLTITSPLTAQDPHPSSARSRLPAERHQRVSHRQSGVGKTYLAKIIAWRACQANQRVLFTTAMDMLNHLLASQVDHSLIRKLKIYTEPSLLVSMN